MSHYDDDTLGRFALDPALVDHPESVAVHLDACDVCQAKLAALREVDDAMREGETWMHVDAFLTRSSRLEEALAFEARLDEEDRAAERLLSPLVTSPRRFRDANVAENPKAQHGGVVRYLCAAAHGEHEKRPQFSLLLARTAHTIARSLENRPHTGRRYYMALSLREGANAFRYLGKFAEALHALDRAEKLFDESPPSDPHDIAIVWFIRATVWMELDRLEDARNLARRAVQIFRDYGDHSRELGALLVEASSLYYAGKYVEAAPAYEVLASRARADGNRNVLARAVSATASTYLELEQFAKAERNFVEALVLFDELGFQTEKARVEWSLALTLVRRGDLIRGGERLDAARGELQRLGLVNDHALATLDWAAARLALGESAGVPEACRSIIVRFESEGMMKNARLALAYVHEALACRTATPALLQQVRAYLEHLPSRPGVIFVPVQ